MPAIALGTWLGFKANAALGQVEEPKSNETEQAVIYGLEAGYRHIDTASIYGIEDQVGRALNKKFAEGLKREDVFVTTKLWNDSHAREAVVPALQASLKKLNLDCVDLYLIHFPVGTKPDFSLDYNDYAETWRGMMDAKNLGLTKSIGLSNFNKQQITRLLEMGLQKPAALQVEINLNIQQPDLLSYCKEQNIAVMGYTPFGSLFHQKAKKNAPPPRVDEPALLEIARKYKKTVPQIILRYLIELGVVPLPKSITKSCIEQNLNVFDFELTAAERELMKNYDNNYRTMEPILEPFMINTKYDMTTEMTL